MWTSVEDHRNSWEFPDSGRSECDLGDISKSMCDLGLEVAKPTVVACMDSKGRGRSEGVSRRAKVEVRLEKGRVTVRGRGLRLEQRSEKGALCCQVVAWGDVRRPCRGPRRAN